MDKETIRLKLKTNDEWLYRGILAIYSHQTEDEKRQERTKHDNGVGFNGADAPFLSSIARHLINRKNLYGHYILSEKQKEVSRRKILKYAGQLAWIAKNNRG